MFFTSVNLTQASAKETLGSIIWDSGASTHIMKASAIRHMTNITRRDSVVFMNSAPARATHVGDVVIIVQNYFIELKDVLVVPDSNANLISIPKLQKTGFGVNFQPATRGPATMTIERVGNVVIQAKYSALPTTRFSYANVENVNVIYPHTVPLWLSALHRRLTHAKLPTIKALEGTKELRLTRAQRAELQATMHIPCQQCDAASINKKSVRSSESSPPLEKNKGTVHVDLHGPLTASIGGSRWILAARHAVSGLLVVCFTDGKGISTREALKESILTLMRVYGVEVKFLRTDRGGEFMSTDISLWLTAQAIEHQPTEAESSKRNGMVEVIWRIIIPRAKAMIATANMDKRYWAEAVDYAAKVLNMMPSRTRNKRSPIEIATGRKPDLRRVQPWGCLVHVKVLRGEVRKGDLSSMSKKCVLLNFSGKDGYKCLHISTNRVIHSRDVSFHPECFPFAGHNLPTDPDFEAEVDTDVRTSMQGQQSLSPDPPIRRSSRVTWDPNMYDPSAYVMTREAAYKESWALQPKTVRQATHPDNPNRERWKEAIISEVRGLIQNNTFVIDDMRPGDEKLRSHFVLGHKTGPSGETTSLKARLCANGKPQMDTESFAPTPKWSTIRFFLKLIVDRELFAQQVDVNQAYLLSLLPKGTKVVIGPPVGYPFPIEAGKILRLVKCLYGLKQSGRHWNKNVHAFIQSIAQSNFRRSEADPCFYVDTENNVFILVFVDDFIIAGVKAMVTRVLTLFKQRYPIKELGEPKWYLKCKIVRDIENGWLHLSQRAYAEAILEEASMSGCNAVSTPCDDFLYVKEEEVPVSQEKAEQQRKIIGMLLYLSIATRGDIAFAVGQLCKFMSKPYPSVWTYTKRVLRYLKGTIDYGLLFRRTQNSKLVGYTDSDFAGDKANRKSMSGMIWEYGGDVISWRCKQQATIATSVMNAELVAMTEGAKEGMYLRKLARSLGPIGPTTMYVDNSATLSNARDFRITQGNKHIDVRHFYIRELVDEGHLVGEKVNSSNNKSDMMTKPQGTSTFLKNRDKLNFVPPPMSSTECID